MSTNQLIFNLSNNIKTLLREIAIRQGWQSHMFEWTYEDLYHIHNLFDYQRKLSLV